MSPQMTPYKRDKSQIVKTFSQQWLCYLVGLAMIPPNHMFKNGPFLTMM